MPVLTIAKTYVNGNILSSTDLDTSYNSISTFLNTTKLDSANIQTGGITGTNIANGTITQANLGSGIIGAAQLASSAVGQQQLNPGAVGSNNIASSAVGPLQRAPLNYVTSATVSGAFTTTSTQLIPVTNCVLTITTNGRPVAVQVASQGGNIAYVGVAAVSAAVFQIVNVSVASSAVSTQECSFSGGALIPGSSISGIDFPVPGTYTYQLYASNLNGATTNVNNCGLVAYEL